MKRVTCMAVLAGILAISVGCVAVVGNKGSIRASDKRIVVMDKQVYVVDVDDGSVERIDPNSFADAPIAASSVV